jgi:chromosome segregation ATPase
MTTGRTPAAVLREARRKDSLTKRQRVRAAVDEMAAGGQPITFAAVARSARVSTWLVYADGVREHIEQARRRQAAHPLRHNRAGAAASTAGLATDLQLATEQIRQLRAERDKLRERIRLHLGEQLDQISSKTLLERIGELTDDNQRLASQHRQAAAENEQLRARIAALEDDLAAARTSLRRVLKQANRAGGG